MAKQFVCVRMQSMNGVNLDLFRFEYDLTWMSFFMDANDRFYARYGGRDDTSAESHLNQRSLVRVMKQVLDLHIDKKVRTSRDEPSPKTVHTPEEIPPMKKMLAKRKNKCIHCHDVKVASLKHLQNQGRFLREMVFTYPTPGNVGIQVDPNEQSRVKSVTADSPAAKAGMRSGDVLVSLDGQRILTLADFSRLLELKPKNSSLSVVVKRGDRTLVTTLRLSGNWRKTDDPSWRESLHVAGPSTGLWGRKLTPEEKRKAGIATDALALKVTFIWGAHTRRAGVKVNDIIVALDGHRRDMNIKQVHAHSMLNKNYGDTIPMVVRRSGRDRKIRLTFPSGPPD